MTCKGCGKRVKYERLVCVTCWNKLPADTQAKIRRLGSALLDAQDEYLRAVNEALETDFRNPAPGEAFSVITKDTKRETSLTDAQLKL